jgi:hypothetical protein
MIAFAVGKVKYMHVQAVWLILVRAAGTTFARPRLDNVPQLGALVSPKQDSECQSSCGKLFKSHFCQKTRDAFREQ